jgi:cyclopropane fatty-acyl-phospholipid synthase-like methyltransferase
LERYFTELASCFIRGRLSRDGDWPSLLDAAQRAGLRLHKFKQNQQLPRVAKILGMLRSIQPLDLLDAGSGRGTSLWPLLAGFPNAAVTAVELHPQRLADLDAVRRGGCNRLSVVAADMQRLPFRDESFDVVTLLEVLEHLPDPALAARSALNIARRFVLVTVPSKEDENPEHIHLFTETRLREMFESAGATRLQFDGVLNHRVLLVKR